MKSPEHIIPILYDISQVIGSEVKTSPLLKRTLQRLLYHTGYSCGIALKKNSDGSFHLGQAIGDRESQKHTGLDISVPETKSISIKDLPVRQEHYHKILQLEIPDYGFLILLDTEQDNREELDYKTIFQPIMANLSKSLKLCKNSEAYTERLERDKEALTDVNTRFRESLDATGDYIILADWRSETIIDYNKTVTHTLGYYDSEIKKAPLKKIFSEESYNDFHEMALRIKNDKLNRIITTNLSTKTRKSLPVELRLSLLSRKGKGDILILVATDLTKRKESEKALYEAKQLAETTLNSIGDAVITTDKNSLINGMNPIAEKITGYSLNEAKGKHLNEIFHIIDASTRQPMESPAEIVMRTGQTVHLSNNTTLISKDKSEHQIADSAAAIRNIDNEILGLVLVFNDVTEQYQLKEDLALREKRQRETLDSLVDSVITIDEEGKIMTFNRSAENAFGYKTSDVIGKDINSLIKEENEHREHLIDFMKTSTPSTYAISADFTAKRKDGTTFPVRLSIGELAKDDPTIRFFLLSYQNVTYLKSKEEQLRRSQKMEAIGNLTGGIAHDYNNMLGVIQGYAELLMLAIRGEDEQSRKLVSHAIEIQKAAKRGYALTKKILSFTRSDALAPEQLSINKVIEEELDVIRKTLTSRITVLTNLSEDIYEIYADKNELIDSILNISINAMHAISGSGQIAIQTYNQHIDSHKADILHVAVGDYAVLSITDTGCGMKEDVIPRIFDPFYSTKGEKGTGLGLSQVYGFIERNKGAIEVHSTEGEGTTLFIYFPRSEKSDKASSATGVQTENYQDIKGTETILVVDDEDAIREFLAKVLEEFGYNVITATRAQEAIEILKDTKVDLTLTDVIMPGMNGFQLASHIKKHHPAVKIQIMSGFFDEEESKDSDESLVENMLEKPFTISSLIHNIRKLLNEK